MRTSLVLIAVLALGLPAWGKGGRAVTPFETTDKFVAKNVLDEAAQAAWKKKRIKPSLTCSDAVFLRRVFLDVIGTLPTPDEVEGFLGNRHPDRRARMIDRLLEREEFCDYWSLKWCDWLRVKAEFPINLWPNAVQAYHRWLRDAIRENRPYDRVAYAMITASGSNFRVPAVNFCRAMQSREPAALAHMVALTFMGVRYENLPETGRDGMAAFFSRVAYKRTVEWKEEIVFTSPAPTGPIDAIFPDGTPVTIAPDQDPRIVFADWLVKPDNPWFAKNMANRVWAWLMGRGVIHEPDDLRSDNRPSNPRLLTVLARELVVSDYDLRHLFRLILNSATYQRSSIPRSDHPEAEALFAHAIVRRLDAEVLVDALCQITGATTKYESPIPEPFTFVPEDNRTIALTDGSITSPFLEMFGRPARDTGLWSERNNRSTAAQRLHMLNSSSIQTSIERSWRLGLLLRGAGRDGRRAVRSLYMLVLSRPPSAAEIATLTAYGRKVRLNPRQIAQDLVWALINSKEFLYRH